MLTSQEAGTLYAELLDELRRLDAEALARDIESRAFLESHA